MLEIAEQREREREREKRRQGTSSWSSATDAFEWVAANKTLPCQNKVSTLGCCVSTVLRGVLLKVSVHNIIYAGVIFDWWVVR